MTECPNSPRFAASPDASIWLDHVLIGTPDVEQTAQKISAALGVQFAAGGRHLGMGTKNVILGLGGSYLEVIGPDPEDEQFSGERWFGIDRVAGAKVVGWSAGVSDLDRVRSASLAAGWNPGEIVASERNDEHGATIRWRRSDTELDRRGGVVPFLVEWTVSRSPGDTLSSAASIDSFALAHPQPDQISTIFTALGLGHLEVEPGPAGVQVTLRSGDRTFRI